MNEQQITKLIERYFAAETTLEEEKELRRLLADPSTAHIPMADEARAVIGWARMNATPRRRILPTAFLKIMFQIKIKIDTPGLRTDCFQYFVCRIQASFGFHRRVAPSLIGSFGKVKKNFRFP